MVLVNYKFSWTLLYVSIKHACARYQHPRGCKLQSNENNLRFNSINMQSTCETWTIPLLADRRLGEESWLRGRLRTACN